MLLCDMVAVDDEGLPDVPGLLVLRSHVSADCICPAVQSLDNSKLVNGPVDSGT